MCTDMTKTELMFTFTSYVTPVRVHAVTENAALLKPAIQSSQYEDCHATRAVDGLIDSSHVSCTSGLESTAHSDSWWAVDLGSPMDVARVCVTNDYNLQHGTLIFRSFHNENVGQLFITSHGLKSLEDRCTSLPEYEEGTLM